MTQGEAQGPVMDQVQPAEAPQGAPERNHRLRRIGAGIAAGALVVGSLAAAYFVGRGDSDPAAAVDPTALESDVDIRALLTVSDTDVTCEEVATASGTASVVNADGETLIQPKVNGTLRVDPFIRTQDNRLWSDAVANPTTSDQNDREAIEREIGATWCEDSVVASMAANYFANMDVNGVKVVDLNPWLKKYQGDPSGINEDAHDLLPYYGDEELNDEEYEQTVDAVKEHEELAEKLMTLMNRFANDGVQEHTTVMNYHEAAGSLTVGQLPEVVYNDAQYAGRFLTFKLTAKDGRCFKVMLVNVDDQRIAETLDCAPVIPEVPGTTPETPTTTPETPTTTIPNKVLVPTPGPGGTVIMPPVQGDPTPDIGEHPVGGKEPAVEDTLPKEEPKTAPGGDTGTGTEGTLPKPKF